MNRIIIPLLLIVIAAISSCKQAPVEYVHRVDTLYVIDTSGSRLKGNLHGSVALADYHLASPYYSPDYSGATVRIEGTTFTTTSDSSGRWTISNLPAGIYTIVISKEGFGTYRLFDQQFVGGGDRYLKETPTLGRIPTDFSINHLRVDIITDSRSGTSYSFLGDISPDSLPRFITPYLFAVVDSSTSIDPTTMIPIGGITIDANTGKIVPGMTSFVQSLLYKAGFKKGERVYITCNFGFVLSSTYWNPALGLTINPGISRVHSNFVEITVP